MNQKTKDYYQNKIDIYYNQKVKYENIFKKSSVIRFCLFLICVICLFIFHEILIGIYIVTTISIIFGVVLIYQERNQKKYNNLIATIKLFHNELSLNEIFPAKSEKYLEKDHNYAFDLDVFGNNSLFNFVNRCNSSYGFKTLASWLSAPSSYSEILERQEATKEISEKTDFRIKIGIAGILNRGDEVLNEENNWISNEKTVCQLRQLKITVSIFMGVSFILLFLSILNGLYLPVLILFLIFTNLFIYSHKWTKIKHIYDNISKTDKSLKYYNQFITIIEEENFRSSLLQRLKEELKVENKSAIKNIKSLQNSIKWIDYRLNFMYQMFINTLFYTDIILLYQIENWKLLYGSKLNFWQKTIGHFEALNSLSILHFNNPDWCFPTLSKEFKIELFEAGHPLIPDIQRVTNNYKINKLGNVDIITGANMSGKSTFLRTIGVNIILALAGAPVCCNKMIISPLKLMTYMRINDNLQDGTSTFYAEIKRLKSILEEIKNDEYAFMLLDELLRGTNSRDRSIGTGAIIESIINKKTTAIIATHDLSITKMQNKYIENIRNYHFDISVKEKEMYFDYKLKEGVSSSTNASILMSKIGIELKIK